MTQTMCIVSLLLNADPFEELCPSLLAQWSIPCDAVGNTKGSGRAGPHLAAPSPALPACLASLLWSSFLHLCSSILAQEVLSF